MLLLDFEMHFLLCFKSRIIGKNIVLWSEIDWIFWKTLVSFWLILVIIWSRSAKLCKFTIHEAAKFKGKSLKTIYA